MVELSLSFSAPTKNEFTITENATNQIMKLLKLENLSNYAFRVKVTPGGCAGFLYDFEWINENDLTDQLVFENDGVKVVIGQADMRLINGSTLDFIETLAASKFEIINPNAQATCGCGKSFA